MRGALAMATAVFPTGQTAIHFGRITASLQRVGKPIPTNDAWNAALTLEHDMPLLEGVEPPPMPAFTVLKCRWVVERTFAWLGNYRRLSKDYEYLPATEESFIYLAMTRLMLRRLRRPAKR